MPARGEPVAQRGSAGCSPPPAPTSRSTARLCSPAYAIDLAIA